MYSHDAACMQQAVCEHALVFLMVWNQAVWHTPVELWAALHPVSQAGLVMRLRVEARLKQIRCEGNEDIVPLQVLQANLQKPFHG